MVKNRLIFTLLHNKGNYILSRNFCLQKVGNLKWLRKNYNSDAIAFSIDELVVLNVEKAEKNTDKFLKNLIQLSRNIFLPIAAGGGIRSIEDAYKFFGAGADKLVVNTAIMEQPDFVRLLSEIFGSQSVVASVDCKKEGNSYRTYIRGGSVNTNLTPEEMIKRAEDLGAGEIYLTSIDRDGTGEGYDIKLLSAATAVTRLPVIASGGAGMYEHFVEGVKKGGVAAVSTANLFNFLVDGLTKTREFIQKEGIELATWDYHLEKLYHCCHKEIK
jgi:imidazole glycerol-phosphate synthase subunit HisF